MGLNLKKVLAILVTAQLVYSTVLIILHVLFAKSISGFWHGELLAHFLHYEMVLACVLVTALVFRFSRKGAALFMIAALLSAFGLYKNSRPFGDYQTILAPVKKDFVLQVICYNGNTNNPTKERLPQWLQNQFRLDIPTVVVVLEASPDWAEALKPLAKNLPYALHQLREDNFGMYISSNIKLDALKFEPYTIEEVPAVLGELHFAGKSFAFAAVHPVPPIMNQWYHDREEYLKGVKDWLVSTKKPGIVCGDFNTTAWTKSYDNFRAPPSPLKDTFWGPLRPLTWGVWGLNTSIDFIFYAPEFELLYANTGPKMGSDHAPVHALLRWK